MKALRSNRRWRVRRVPHRLLFSMNLEPNSTFGPITQGTVAVIDNEFKYIDRLGTQEVSLYQIQN